MKRWSKEERLLALGLYCQMPYGKIHSRNPVIARLAGEMGRTSSSLAMKMLNFASLDPLIVNSGRKGLGNASDEDVVVWNEFNANREALAEAIEARLEAAGIVEAATESLPLATDAFRYIKQRRGQRFFRASVLASYRSTCCISGITDMRLLIASHIVPWRENEQARLDPRNGLCLSSLHDRLFDAGIITVARDHRILVSQAYVKNRTDHFSRVSIHSLHGSTITLPEKFAPLDAYLEYHNHHVFEQNAG